MLRSLSVNSATIFLLTTEPELIISSLYCPISDSESSNSSLKSQKKSSRLCIMSLWFRKRVSVSTLKRLSILLKSGKLKRLKSLAILCEFVFFTKTFLLDQPARSLIRATSGEFSFVLLKANTSRAERALNNFFPYRLNRASVRASL
ncbi:hypothetical protein SDC9_205268 [bioreactor metagenome]|uniref:Uncharacterized protein n=1 Tax=bioreactor metagenome TaxID=1076179 RepID=A0A645JAU0_9ZZZZ